MARREASNLRDLLLIRERNKDRIEAINGNLGCALGFKYTNGQQTNHPSIIIFVPEKIREDLIPESQIVPKQLEAHLDDASVIYCKTDVVAGGKAPAPGPVPPLDEENRRIVEELRSGRVGIVGGVQIAGYDDRGGAYVGTAGCAVVDSGGRVGILTNQHVSGPRGRPIYCPNPGRYSIGQTELALEYVTDEAHYGGTVDESDALVRVDCGFVALSDSARRAVAPGLFHLGELGDVAEIDVDGMGIIGTEVISIGRTRGLQRGVVVAYAYEWRDEDRWSIYTDLLIIGESPDGAFSDHGDSGKLIVTAEGLRPVGLLWGGWQERLRKGREQERWTYAIDLAKVLKYLGLTVLR